MQEIVIRNNGVDSSVFKNTHNVSIEELQFNGEGSLSTCTLSFDFNKLEHNQKVEKPKKVWTGKFICVANRNTTMAHYNFTPGTVYKVTDKYVYDNTPTPYNRGKNWIFSCGDFEKLRKDFAGMNIDIIEYKGEALKVGDFE